MGLSWKEGILKGMNYDIGCLSLALASHNHHADHTKALAHCITNGIPCYANQDICDHYKGCNLIENGKALLVDGWKVQTFDLVHNVPNNAFVVDTIDGVRVLYCTDTQYIPKRVRGVNVAIIEANFDEEVLIDNMCENIEIRSQFENHHSLDKCIEYLRSIYSKDLMSVILWHPSSTNLDKKKAVERVKYELGFDNVYMAESGLEVELSNSEF
jgi:phosphoribosyl 1,2-cyclic phosphodiesterase